MCVCVDMAAGAGAHRRGEATGGGDGDGDGRRRWSPVRAPVAGDGAQAAGSGQNMQGRWRWLLAGEEVGDAMQRTQGSRGERSRGGHRVREEDEHVHRYMATMDVRFSNTWQVLWEDDRRYDPMMVPSVWVSTARAQEPRVA